MVLNGKWCVFLKSAIGANLYEFLGGAYRIRNDSGKYVYYSASIININNYENQRPKLPRVRVRQIYYGNEVFIVRNQQRLISLYGAGNHKNYSLW